MVDWKSFSNLCTWRNLPLRCVSQLCPVCVDYSTLPVWRHRGHRQISCPLMSACRRIQQVREKTRTQDAFIRLYCSVSLCPCSVSLSLAPCLSLSLSSQSPHFLYLSLFALYLLMSKFFNGFFSALHLITPLEHCRHIAFFYQCWSHLCCEFCCTAVGFFL